MSLTGALLAVFIQQWALSYLHAIQKRDSPRNRARVRAYREEGLRRLHLPRVTRAVPMLIHLSIFLFFSGLPVFLFNINRIVFNVVVTWLALCVAGYACITLMPIFCHDSPYYSPLSSFIWWCVTNTLFIVYRLLRNFLRPDSFILRWYHAHYHHAVRYLPWPSLGAMQEATVQFVRHQVSSDIDRRALSWMLKTLNDDEEFEQFFDALLVSLPNLKAMKSFQLSFVKKLEDKKKLLHALVGMMDRTLMSDLVSEEVKQRRIIICTKAIDATSLIEPWWILRRVLLGGWGSALRSVHFGLFVQGWNFVPDPITAFYAQHVVAVTLAVVQVRDDNWFKLASEQLNVSKSLLWTYSAYSDNILLSNAIFIIRQTIKTLTRSEDHREEIAYVSKKMLELICRFDIKKTLTENQHKFCGLWNQLVVAAQDDTLPLHVTSLCKMMLKSTRRLYITLHIGAISSPGIFFLSTDDEDPFLDNPESFPKCELSEHEHPDGVPELELGERQRNGNGPQNLDNSMAMTPAMSRPSIPVPPATAPIHPSDSRRTPYYVPPSLPADWSYSVPPPPDLSYSFGGSPHYPSPGPAAPPGGFSPFVPISQMDSSHTHHRRHRQDVPATMAETDSQQDYHVPNSPPASTYTPPSPSELTYTPPSPASPVHRVPSPVPPTWQQPDVISPIIPIPASTQAPQRITTSYVDVPVSHDISGPTTTNRLEWPSSPSAAIIPETLPAPPTVIIPGTLPATPTVIIPETLPATPTVIIPGTLPAPPTVIIPESPPAQPLPTPASAEGSGTAAPVPPVILSSPQERMSSPPSPPSAPQELPVGDQETDIPVKASRDTSPTRHVVSFGIPGPRTPSVVPVPLSSHEMPVVTVPSASSSRVVPIPTHMTRLSAIGRGNHARSTPMATPPVIKFNGYGDLSGLLYYSPHTVVYEDELYPTALHLFEARKFLPHRPDLADRIRQCENVEQVASISAELAEFIRRDWSIVAFSTVSNFPSVMHTFWEFFY